MDKYKLRSFYTVETPTMKASRAKRFHVVTTGDWEGFVLGFDTSEEAVAHTTKGMGSAVAIWDTDTNSYHFRNWRKDFKWCPNFADTSK